jgi:myo-inositol-1(or 4)-monophosphatase
MNVMVEAAEKAGRSLVKDFGEVEHLQVSRKGPGDFVSTADLKSEKIIRAVLEKARPAYGFLMEESGTSKGTDETFRWIVDPLDGTSNFLHGIPHWGVTIALEKDGEVIAGVTYDAIKDELFTAEKGTGAFVNNRRLRVSGRENLAEAMIAMNSVEKALMISDMQAMSERAMTIRTLGSAALDMAYVAAGRMDIFWDRGMKPWDRAAGILLIREAGGIIADFDGNKECLNSAGTIGGNRALQAEAMKRYNDSISGKAKAS